MRVLLDAAAGAACTDWLDASDTVMAVSTPDLTSLETVPRAAAAIAPDAVTFEVFASEGELAGHLIDVALKRFEHLFGSPAFPFFPHVSRDFLLTAENAGPIADVAGDSETNVQTEGVDEADIVETDGRYIYTISRGKLVIVDAQDPEDLRLVSRIMLDGYTDEMYLHGDRLTIVSASSFSGPLLNRGGPVSILRASSLVDEPWTPQVTVTVLDVSSRESPRTVSTTKVDGNLIDSRMSDGQLYLVTAADFQFPHPEVIVDEDSPTAEENVVSGTSVDAFMIWPSDDWSAEGRYETREEYLARVADRIVELSLPTFETSDADGNVIGSGQIASAGTLYKSDLADQNGTVTVSILDTTSDISSIQSSSLLSTGGFFNQQIYAAQSSLYVLETVWSEGVSTRIARFSLVDADGNSALNLTGLGTVQGRVHNSFSVDEFDGYLRIATTSSDWRESINHVFVLDAESADLELVGRIDDIAPGEQIRSARFHGNEAVIVTFRRVDPLFGLDLSDPENPRILGELKINGFSSYLQFIGEDHLIGVGYDADPESGRSLGLQVSVFDISTLSSPELVDRFVFTDTTLRTDATHDHHAITYLAEEGLLAIGLSSQSWLRPWGFPSDRDPSSSMHDLYIFSVDTTTGFALDTMIEHRSEVSRSVQIGDSLISMSDTEVVSISLADYQVQDTLSTHTVAIADTVVVESEFSSQVLDVLANDLVSSGQEGSVSIVEVHDNLFHFEPMPLLSPGLTIGDSIAAPYWSWPTFTLPEIADDGRSLLLDVDQLRSELEEMDHSYWHQWSFVYAVEDGSGALSSATVTLDLSAVAPVDPSPTEDPPAEDPPDRDPPAEEPTDEDPPPDEGTGQPIVAITVEVVNGNGDVISELRINEQAVLNIYVEDTRQDADGVFSVAMDVNFDSGLVKLDEEVAFGPDYQSATNFDFSTPDLVDELRAVGGIRPSGAGRFLLASLPFVAEGTGTANFNVDPAESVNHETLVYGLFRVMDVDDIDYGTTSLEILDPSVVTFENVAAVDINGDGQVTPLDALLVIHELEGVPEQAAGDAGSQPGLRAALAIGTNKYDVNGDGRVTPFDALLVINSIEEADLSTKNLPRPASSASAVADATNMSGAAFALSSWPTPNRHALRHRFSLFEGEIHEESVGAVVDAVLLDFSGRTSLEFRGIAQSNLATEHDQASQYEPIPAAVDSSFADDPAFLD